MLYPADEGREGRREGGRVGGMDSKKQHSAWLHIHFLGGGEGTMSCIWIFLHIYIHLHTMLLFLKISCSRVELQTVLSSLSRYFTDVLTFT